MSDLKPRSEKLDMIVAGHRARIDDKRIHVRPDIPTKKLHNAIQTYAPAVAEADVLALVDDTIRGSGKDGCLLTATAIYGHDAALPPVMVSLAQLRSFTRERKGSNSILRADGATVCTLTLVQPENIDTFAQLVADVAHPERATVEPVPGPAVPGGPETMHLVLSHLLSAEWHRDAFESTSKARFDTFPITVTRPAEGERVETTSCPDCGRTLDIRVVSHPALVERMKRWGMVLLAGLVVAGAAMVAAAASAGVDSTALFATVMASGMIGALVATFGGIFLWEDYKVDRDHGVKVGQVGKQTLG